MTKHTNLQVFHAKPLHALVLALGLFLPPVVSAQASAQSHFATPDAAVEALVDSVAINDPAQMRAILGNDYRKLLPLDEVSQDDLSAFLQAWAQGHSIKQTQEHKAWIA